MWRGYRAKYCWCEWDLVSLVLEQVVLDIIAGHGLGADGACIVDCQFVLLQVAGEVGYKASGRLDSFLFKFAKGHLMFCWQRFK